MLALAGGVSDTGWLSRFDRFVPLVDGWVEAAGRPRFFCVAALESEMILSRPPTDSR